MAFAANAWSQNVGVRATSIWGGAEPNNAAGAIVVYNLPASGSIYAGPAAASFNVLAAVQSPATSQQVAGYGIIMAMPASGELTFNVPALPTSGTPNNVPNAVSNSFQSPMVVQNANLSIILGDTGVPGQPTGNLSLGVVGLYPTANANTTVNNGDGLFSVPFRVAGGTTGTFNLGLALGGDDLSGFAQTDGTIVTNAAGFPQVNQTIVVRNSRRGDMNGDGNTNSADIGGFILALNGLGGPTGFKAQFPWLQAEYISDFDQSGATNSADIGGFIAALSGAPSPAAVPEPSSVALLCVAGMLGGAAAIRRRYR